MLCCVMLCPSPLAPYTANVVSLYYRCPELLLGASRYCPALDMWSVGCVLGELLLKKPLFAGSGELDQVYKIFQVMGVPTEDRWPGFSSLPLAQVHNWRGSNRYF